MLAVTNLEKKRLRHPFLSPSQSSVHWRNARWHLRKHRWSSSIIRMRFVCDRLWFTEATLRIDSVKSMAFSHRWYKLTMTNHDSAEHYEIKSIFADKLANSVSNGQQNADYSGKCGHFNGIGCVMWQLYKYVYRQQQERAPRTLSLPVANGKWHKELKRHLAMFCVPFTWWAFLPYWSHQSDVIELIRSIQLLYRHSCVLWFGLQSQVGEIMHNVVIVGLNHSKLMESRHVWHHKHIQLRNFNFSLLA